MSGNELCFQQEEGVGVPEGVEVGSGNIIDR